MSMNAIATSNDMQPPPVPMFYVVSLNKLVGLMLLTGNLYAFYWFYRNWSAYRQATGASVIPLLRSIVPVLFVYPLLSRVDRGFRDSGREYNWSPLVLSLGMWLVVVVGGVSCWLAPTPPGLALPSVAFWMQGLLEMVVYIGLITWLFCLAQRAINVHEGDPKGQANSQITAANWDWIALGVLLWVFSVAIVAVAIWSSFWWAMM